MLYREIIEKPLPKVASELCVCEGGTYEDVMGEFMAAIQKPGVPVKKMTKEDHLMFNFLNEHEECIRHMVNDLKHYYYFQGFMDSMTSTDVMDVLKSTMRLEDGMEEDGDHMGHGAASDDEVPHAVSIETS